MNQDYKDQIEVLLKKVEEQSKEISQLTAKVDQLQNPIDADLEKEAENNIKNDKRYKRMVEKEVKKLKTRNKQLEKREKKQDNKLDHFADSYMSSEIDDYKQEIKKERNKKKIVKFSMDDVKKQIRKGKAGIKAVGEVAKAGATAKIYNRINEDFDRDTYRKKYRDLVNVQKTKTLAVEKMKQMNLEEKESFNDLSTEEKQEKFHEIYLQSENNVDKNKIELNDDQQQAIRKEALSITKEIGKNKKKNMSFSEKLSNLKQSFKEKYKTILDKDEQKHKESTKEKGDLNL